MRRAGSGRRLCASLLIDAPTASPARVPYDVDVIAEVAALHGYHALERKFAGRGFSRDITADAPIFRWRVRDIEVDLMPTDESILGLANRWYPAAAASASSDFIKPGSRRYVTEFRRWQDLKNQ